MSFRWDALFLLAVVAAVLSAALVSQRSRRDLPELNGERASGVLLADPVVEQAQPRDHYRDRRGPGVPTRDPSASNDFRSEREMMESVKAVLKAMWESGELEEDHVRMLRYLCRELGDESCAR